MTAQIIDGLALSRQLRAEVAQRTAVLAARGVRPGLAVVLVGDDPASQIYVRNKVKACAETGLHSVLERYPASCVHSTTIPRFMASWCSCRCRPIWPRTA
jgi:methylenetetrahydrofolate dehydrogenase (NADP+)/methenyltetrahydrofolate cyclohydrolase